MVIFGPLQSLEKSGQPPILARVIVGNNGVPRVRIDWESPFFAGGSVREINPSGGRAATQMGRWVASVGCCARKRLTPHLRLGLCNWLLHFLLRLAGI